MQIKSFKAPTLKEAMANVKSELGVDAVILHTNKIKKGGLINHKLELQYIDPDKKKKSNFYAEL